MLTIAEYEDLWREMKITNQELPPYDKYLVRENALKKQLDRFNQNQQIKYILVGEAAPASGNYIYIDAAGSYITAPLRAFCCDPGRSIDVNYRLEKLFLKGVILLDLFPFAIDFNIQGENSTTMRRNMIASRGFGICVDILESTLRNLSNQGKLADDWDFCTVGPETTSIGLLEFLDNKRKGKLCNRPTASHNDRLSSSDFTYSTKKGQVVKKSQIVTCGNYTKTPPALKHNWNIPYLSKRARLTVGTMGQGSGPVCELIQRAFNITCS